jgi:hypothetical protein
MRTGLIMLCAAMVGLYAAPGAAVAQNKSPPTYEADPSVYKVIFENKDFRVIDAVRKAGQQDKPHSHPLPSVVYFLTDCNDDVTENGQVRHSVRKAGEVLASPITQSHTAKNIGSTDCHSLFVERK